MPNDQSAFNAYFTCKDDEGGKLEAFHVCDNIDTAKNWRSARDAEQPDKNSDKASNDDGKDSSSLDICCDNFVNLTDKLMASLMPFYDLIGISASVRKSFPNIYIEREFETLRGEFPVTESKYLYTVYGVPENRISTLNSRIRKFNHINDGISSIPANVLMGLIARFDANISGLVRFLFTSRKEKLATGDRSIPVKDILAANSFEELISDLIDDEIHSLMRNSHDDQVKYIEDNFSIKIRGGCALSRYSNDEIWQRMARVAAILATTEFAVER